MSSKIAQVLAQDDTVLFIGSGLSLWSGLPTWSKLVNELADYIDAIPADSLIVRSEAKKGDLLQAASYGFAKLTKSQIGDFIRQSCLYGKAKPHDIHRIVVNLGPRCFITTNYDNLIEESLKKWQPNIFFRPPITNKHLTEMAGLVQSRSKDFVFKPHGDAGDTDSIILTREQYRKLLPGGELHGTLETVKTLLSSRPVVYIGFGLRDPDFLYLRDLLDNTYKGGIREHYAIMADVNNEEANYWRDNYGLHLVNYTTKINADNSRDHSELISLLTQFYDESSNIKSGNVNHLDTQTTREDSITPNIALVLARHAVHVSRTRYYSPRVEIPVLVNRIKENSIRQSGDRTQKIEDLLLSDSIKAVVSGLPGAGKTYALSKAAVHTAAQLQKSSIDELSLYKDITVPIFVDLKLYQGNLWALTEKELPAGISLDFAISHCNVKLFIDSFNEMPREYRESSQYEQDFIDFFAKIKNTSFIIGSRTDDGLNKFNLTHYSIDEIDRKFVETELNQLGFETQSVLRNDIISLFQKPFYFQLLKSNTIDILNCTSPGSIYKNLLTKTDNSFKERFSTRLNISKALALAAYEAINKGEEAMPVSYLIESIKSQISFQKIRDLKPEDVANWLVSQSLMISYSGGRIAFFHQSITEYLASSHFADIYAKNRSILKEKISFTRWDQAVFLTISHLSKKNSQNFVNDIVKYNTELALIATKYLEADSSELVSKLLKAIPKSLKGQNYLETRIEWALEYAMPINSSHENDLLSLMSHGNMLAGSAFKRLAEIKGESIKFQAFDLIIQNKDDYNYCRNGIAPAIKKYVKKEDLPVIMSLLDSVDFDNQDQEHEDISGLVSAFAFLIDDIDTNFIWEFIYKGDKEISAIRTIVFIDSLYSIHTTSALKAASTLLLKGHAEASTSLYFIIRFAKDSNTLEYDFFTREHVHHLLNEIKSSNPIGWPIKALRLICKSRQDLSYLVDTHSEEAKGLLSVFLTYCTSFPDQKPVFKKLQSLLLLDKSEIDKQPIEMLKQLSLKWHGEEVLFVKLLRLRNNKLAYALIESLGQSKAINQIDIGPIDWWLDWLKGSPHNDTNYFFKQRFFELVEEKTSKTTHDSFILEFNTNELYRPVLADSPLLSRSGISTDDISVDAISFLMANITGVGQRALSSLATENFINEHLLPLVTLTKGKMQQSVLSIIRTAGRRHGRRYIA